MKKILLASTILAGTAGFAAADNANFTFSGAAYTGLAFSMGWDETVVGDINGDGALDADAILFVPEVTAEFTVGMMTTTDGGLEAGTSITVTAGGLTMEGDHTETNFGDVELKGGISDASVYLSGEWGKFVAEYEGDAVDGALNLLPGDDLVDFRYSNSFGDFDIFAQYEYKWGPNNDDFTLEGTYNFADYAIWAGAEWNEAVTDYWVVWFGASASVNGFSAEAEATYDDSVTDWDFYAEVGYSMDAYSLGAFIEDDGTDDNWDYGVNASYDLGGGVSIDASYVFDQDTDLGVAKAGVSMSF